MQDKSLVATIFTGLLAAGSLVAITVMAVTGADIPSEVRSVLMLSVGGTITAAGVATASRPSQ